MVGSDLPLVDLHCFFVNDMLFISILFVLLFGTVNFNWVYSGNTDSAMKRACIDLEYSLRPRITKFLLTRVDGECCGDFSCYHFDVDVKRNWVWISEKTPKECIKKILPDFDTEINGAPIPSVA